MRDEHYTPFTGQRYDVQLRTRVLRQFHKPGHRAELCERRITQFSALEWLLVVDGSLIESRMYHGARLTAYLPEPDERAQRLQQGGWVEDPTARPAVEG